MPDPLVPSPTLFRSYQLALGRLGRQRRLEAELADLLVQVVGVVAHHRAEHRAAAAPLRGAGRAHARVAGALLAEQLAGRAGNLAAGLHLVGAGATLGQLPVDRKSVVEGTGG